MADVAYVLGMDVKRTLRWYKKLSGYEQQKQKGQLKSKDLGSHSKGDHISVPVVQMDNYGQRIGIDEKYINQNYYTILYNLVTSKIIMVVKSTKSNEVYRVIRTYFTQEQMFSVEVVTKDCAGNYDWLARQAFPNAAKVADKFHVMGLIYDALQQLRIQFKNEYNIAMQDKQSALNVEYKQKLEEAKKSGERIDKKLFVAQESLAENGENYRQILTRSKYLLYKSEADWNSEQNKRAQALFKSFPVLHNIYLLIQKFKTWYSLDNLFKDSLKLNSYFDQWIKDLRIYKYSPVASLISTLKNEKGNILNYFQVGDTNAVAESINRQIQKLIGRMYGIRDLDFFFFRLTNHLT